MKPSDLTSPEQPMLMLRLQTINECPLRSTEPSLAHSKGKPNVSLTTNNINIRFATPLIEEMQVRALGMDAGWLRPAWAGPLATLPIFL